MTESSQSDSRVGKPAQSQTEAAAEVTRLDQIAWEAPQLRPTLVPYGAKETWTLPCPDWCTGEGPGHDIGALLLGGWRRHQSASLRVRHDSGRVYEVADDESDEAADDDGIRAGNLELALRASSRAPDRPYVQMTIHGGRAVDGRVMHIKHDVGGFYPDEVRELICVLQHLLKVAQA